MDGPHDGWTRPSGRTGAEPRWGHRAGLQVGLAPLPGPRGLIRIYAPHLGHARDRVLNFIAVEPIVAGATSRGLSELERSDLDGVPGKRMWSVDDPEDEHPRDPADPASGRVEEEDGVERLRVTIGVERFAAGAEVEVDVAFRADRPHEVTVAARRRSGSAPLAACVLTATMGNYARLRRLHLAEGVLEAAALWSDFAGDGFTEHLAVPLHRLARRGGEVVVSATPDETDPASATYGADVGRGWRWAGRTAVQTWRAADAHPALVAQVNGRATYWASTAPIPGGVAYENFELLEPFRDARPLTYSAAALDDRSDSPDSVATP